MASSAESLWSRLSAAGPLHRRFLRSATAELPLSRLEQGSSLSVERDGLRGRSLLIATEDQLAACLAMIELDTIAARMVLCPPCRPLSELRAIAREAQADTIVSDQPGTDFSSTGIPHIVWCNPNFRPGEGRGMSSASDNGGNSLDTEWVLLTSGTSGEPKLVAHTLASLSVNLQSEHAVGRDTTWTTFYDIRRYGGLQILLRVLLGGSSLVLSCPNEPIGDYLDRARAAGVTHITGTPSHWRRLLMSGAAQRLSPRYVRLSGEIADQPVLDGLRAAYPNAALVHAFAATEAGLAFEVHDGLAGFPASVLAHPPAGIEIKLEQDSMLIRSPRTATRYLNHDAAALREPDGFVDTHDLVTLRDGRYYFIGRRGGIINVGGLKCHPEEIESVINAHPRVQMSLVKARRNPLLGSIVVAEVVLRPDGGDDVTVDAVKDEILQLCRRSLSAHKVPATVRIVPSLAVAPSGKLQRSNG